MTKASNNTKALLGALANNDAAYAAAEASDGSGSMGNWPPEGVYQLCVTPPTIEETTLRDEQGAEHKALAIQFGYATTDPPEGHTDNMIFRGASFFIPINPENLPGSEKKGTKARIRIDMERLKGHCKTILGREPSDSLQADLADVVDVLSSEASCVVRAYLQYQVSKTNQKTYRKEFLQEKMA
jgi:hypothetical protein